ncbi:TetR/AcrR family transcriptional regulator [Clostridium grantii]|uniref:Transcriptional regulator, TetR family n=1 Tax=Clostridium grantii DSM 8605 TaxID=1121316 RepID=A0A1M5X669_9CLOT|nr:TetR/AcrR family transcriptional regulator [Clostridium grantii]SHH95289.1 transcriptional regulator, TetR family [Clostridium grantii DSM 8605]
MKSNKEKRQDNIKEEARKLFIKKNIEQATFAEIAKNSKVGEATIYRNYPNKGELAMVVAMDYVTDLVNDLEERLSNKKDTHIVKFEKLLDYYIEVFINKPDYFIYMEHFDNFIAHSSEKPSDFNEYEKSLYNIVKVLCDVYSGEKLDNSIDANINVEMAVYTFNITFISLCQKLLLRGKITSTDLRFDAIDELKLMKKIYIDYLKVK